MPEQQLRLEEGIAQEAKIEYSAGGYRAVDNIIGQAIFTGSVGDRKHLDLVTTILSPGDKEAFGISV